MAQGKGEDLNPRRQARAPAICRAGCFPDHQPAAASTMSEHFSPIMIEGAFVFPEVSVGMTEASAIRRCSIPWTRSSSSTTASASRPILHVHTGWYVVSALLRTHSRSSSSV